MNIKLVSSVIFVKDIKASRAFYEEVLGQKPVMDHGLNVGYEGGFALWQLDSANQSIFGDADHRGTGGEKHAAELYFETGQLDDVMQDLEKNTVQFIHRIREQPWGQRVTRFFDPDGHILEIGEPMYCVIQRLLDEGLEPAGIAQRTFMPLEIVKQIVAAAG